MALILITHDLGVVAEMADSVVVMYAGDVAEERSAAELFSQPAHPYSAGLLGSLPRIDRNLKALLPIEGAVPSPLALPLGCAFEPRCRAAQADCKSQRPLPRPHAGGRVACLHPLAGTS